MKQTANLFLATLAAWTLASAAHAQESSGAWPSLPEQELAARRAGLRIGGLDVSVEVRLRDRIDAGEPAPVNSVFQSSDFGGLTVLAQLVNRLDGVRIERDAEIRVRIDGFGSVFGSSSLRTARARLRTTFE